MTIFKKIKSYYKKLSNNIIIIFTAVVRVALCLGRLALLLPSSYNSHLSLY